MGGIPDLHGIRLRHRGSRLRRLRARQSAVGGCRRAGRSAGSRRMGSQSLAAPARRLLQDHLRRALLPALSDRTGRRRLLGVRSSGRAGGSSAAPVRSTDCCTFADSARTMTTGRRRERPDGITVRSCPISNVRNATRAGRASFTAPAANSACRNCATIIRIAALGWSAAQQYGLPYNPDMNGHTQYGVGSYQLSIRNRWRSSASRAFLYPALRRPNLTVLPRMHVNRIIFDGVRAVGVECRRAGTSSTESIRCTREVILAAGTIQSPQSPAALRHRSIRPAAPSRCGGAGRGARGRRKSQRSLSGAHNRAAERALVAQRRCPQSDQGDGDGPRTGWCAIAGR